MLNLLSSQTHVFFQPIILHKFLSIVHYTSIPVCRIIRLSIINFISNKFVPHSTLLKHVERAHGAHKSWWEVYSSNVIIFPLSSTSLPYDLRNLFPFLLLLCERRSLITERIFIFHCFFLSMQQGCLSVYGYLLKYWEQAVWFLPLGKQIPPVFYVRFLSRLWQWQCRRLFSFNFYAFEKFGNLKLWLQLLKWRMRRYLSSLDFRIIENVENIENSNYLCHFKNVVTKNS